MGLKWPVLASNSTAQRTLCVDSGTDAAVSHQYPSPRRMYPVGSGNQVAPRDLDGSK